MSIGALDIPQLIEFVFRRGICTHNGKALVIYDAAHFHRTAPRDYLSSMGADIGIVRMLEMDYPRRIFRGYSSWAIGGPFLRGSREH